MNLIEFIRIYPNLFEYSVIHVFSLYFESLEKHRDGTCDGVETASDACEGGCDRLGHVMAVESASNACHDGGGDRLERMAVATA